MKEMMEVFEDVMKFSKKIEANGGYWKQAKAEKPF